MTIPGLSGDIPNQFVTPQGTLSTGCSDRIPQSARQFLVAVLVVCLVYLVGASVALIYIYKGRKQ